jgi:hypothetical protein
MCLAGTVHGAFPASSASISVASGMDRSVPFLDQQLTGATVSYMPCPA